MSTATRLCAWCNIVLGTAIGDFDDEYPITHGICDRCAQAAFADAGLLTVRDQLDGLGFPVLAVDRDVRIQGANHLAEQLLGRSLAELTGLKGGDAIRCVNACTLEGCGHTVFCSACALRNTVEATFDSWTPRVGVPVDRTVVTDTGPRTLRLRISTERVANTVLLRVDEAAVVESGVGASGSL